MYRIFQRVSICIEVSKLFFLLFNISAHIPALEIIPRLSPLIDLIRNLFYRPMIKESKPNFKYFRSLTFFFFKIFWHFNTIVPPRLLEFEDIWVFDIFNIGFSLFDWL